MNKSPANEPRWERRDIDVVALVVLVALMVVGGIATLFGSGALLHLLTQHRAATDQKPPALAEERSNFPQPRLQVSAQLDLEKFRAAQTSELTSYGWVDRKRRVVRIPVERAMGILAERGLPATNQSLTPTQMQQQIPAERRLHETP